MAGTTYRAAVEALAASTRTALRCIAQVEILNSGWDIGISNSLRVISHGQVSPGVILLQRAAHSSYLQHRVRLDYTVILDASGFGRPMYRAEITRYMYAIQDIADRELLAYHWHPTGLSDVRAPHLHVSVAPPIELPARPGGPDAKDLELGRLHFPTRHIDLPEFIRFLIRELGVNPRRSDWESVLNELQH